MFTSYNLPYLIIRLGLAAVFLWFGVDKFIHPAYWLEAWTPAWLIAFLAKAGLSGAQFVSITGIFEILVGLSLIAEIFTKFFAVLAILFLIAIIVTNGLNEIMVRDVGLMASLLAIVFWPSKPSRF